MPASLSATSLRRIFGLYLSAIALITVFYGYHNAKAANDWAIGEWLINYSGGFVRRGLIGEFILLVSRLLHASPIYLALVVQLLAFSILFVNVYRLTRRVRWSFPLAAILLSPATLAFHVLDPPAGFRKEILLFAGLSILVAALTFNRPRPAVLSVLLTLLTQICVLSHEPLVVYLPYLFGATFLAERNLRRAFLISLAPAILAFLSVLAASRHPGDLTTARTICNSVGGTLGASNEGVCGGAILYLTHNLDYARQDTVENIRNNHYLILYPVTAALTLLPFVLLVLELRRDSATRSATARQLATLGITFLTACATSTILFLIGTDWGRWIYIHAICLLLLMLFINQHPERDVVPEGRSATAWGGLPLSGRGLVYALLLVVYAASWTLPHVGIFPGRFGYVDLVRYLHNYKNIKHSVS